MKLLFSVFIALIFTGAGVDSTANAQAEYSTIIRIDVRGEKESKDRAYETFLEEFSRIDDVRIRSKGQIFGFKVLLSAIRPPSRRNSIWGYAATLIVVRYPGLAFVDQVENVLGKSEDGKAYQKLSKQVLERGVMHYASMKVVPKDALEDLCRELVAIFDKEVLKPDRKRFQEIIKLEKELLKKKEEEDALRKAAEEAAEAERKLQEEQARLEAEKNSKGKSKRKKVVKEDDHQDPNSSGELAEEIEEVEEAHDKPSSH